MIKIRLKLIKHNRMVYYPHTLDKRFMNGSISRLPIKGKRIVFSFSRFGLGRWRTTAIQKIVRHKTLVAYTTLNSVYHIKKGWTK